MVVQFLDINFPSTASALHDSVEEYDIPQPLQFDELLDLTLIIVQAVNFMLIHFDLRLQLEDLMVSYRQ